jgi:hypothetical protein
MDAADVQLVWLRARRCCEYCLLQQQHDETPFQIDHVIARKHGGTDKPNNLALACMACNNHKGPNIAGLDSETGQLTRLFDPRTDRWSEHFAWNGPVLEGATPIGRATATVLAINLPYRVDLRGALLAEGVKFEPPTVQS